MGKHLRLGSDPKSETWRLPDDADLEAVRGELESAMADGRAARVLVIVGGEQTAEMLVNGRVVPAAMVWQEEEARRSPGFTMID